MEVFYILLTLLFATRLFGEVAHRMGQPALLGELIAGVFLGLVATHYSAAFPFLQGVSEDPMFTALTNLGIFFLMLLGGVELRAGDLAQASLRSLLVGTCGLVIPAVAGFGLAWYFLPESGYKVAQSLFVGTALAITAVPISVGILMELGKLNSRVGKTIISAAIVDDIFSLLMLAFLVGLVKSGTLPDWFTFVQIVGGVIIFFLVTFVVARVIIPRFAKFATKFKTAEFEFTLLLLGALTFSILAEALHLHFILGAFVAGLLFDSGIAGDHTYTEVKKRITAVTTGFLAPIFFASIGMHLHLSAITEIPLFLTLLILVAFFSKIVGSGLPAYWTGLSKKEAWAVGVGMSARGAVELIIAKVALEAGLFEMPQPLPPEVEHLFSAIVIVALVTTLATPFALKRALHESPNENG